MIEPIRIGTRGSLLARIQAGFVVDALDAAGEPSRIEVIETDGDRRAQDTAWGEGAFVAAIEQALLDGRVDVAVHSAKDVPTDVDPHLRIGAYLPRADPRDALVVRAGALEQRLDDLPIGSRVGTDSPRRTGFLLARRPDLDVHPLHGNVDTRLRRLEDGETDALVLACAGLDRLGLGERIAERLDPALMPPAPGQGAIAVQVRADDDRIGRVVGAIDDHPTRVAVEAERAFLDASGGGCRSPIGALASVSETGLELLGGFAGPDGSGAVTFRRRGDAAAGPRLAAELADALRHASRRVLVTRSADQADGLLAALRAEGLQPVAVPAIAIDTDSTSPELDAVLTHLGDYAWAVLTSPNGVRATREAGGAAVGGSGPRWAAVGEATAEALRTAGAEVAFRPSRASSEALGLELPVRPGERILVVRGDLAGSRLAQALRGRGAIVEDIVGYRTVEGPATSRALLREALSDGPIGAILLASGSAARGLREIARIERLEILAIPAICIGPETARVAAETGFHVVATSPTPDLAAIAATVAAVLPGRSIPELIPMEASR
ncbi:MAG TPA: hydroxymethylbilane synthase [Candidatus Limnocylindrales bacterium]